MKGYFNYKGGKIYFEIIGKGQPVTFIHGFSLDQRVWKQQVDFFKKRFRVITYDMRGYGKSSIPKQKHSHHDDLRALLNYLNIPKTHLVGLSLGGEIAADFAVTHPNKLISLCLVDSSLGGYPSTVDWNVKAKEHGIKQAKINWLNHPVFKTTRTNKKVVIELKKMMADYSGWQWLNPMFRNKVSPKPINRLDRIICPTLIIVGEKDLTYYHSIANVLKKGIKNSQKQIIKGAGHMVNMEGAQEFNHELFEFLNSVSN
ncbi:alpha/beta hydrolase [Microgenomates group bacterium]|nr:alpha/beta hydrolase [Microgenomates group bacterium]